MSYSTGYQSYIGVPPPQSNTVTSLNIQSGNVTIDGSITPSSDGTVTIGRSTKRFKSAYIQEVKGVTSINDMSIIQDYETGSRNTFTMNQEGTAILVESLSSPYTGTIGSVAVDTTREVIVAVGSKNGNTFAAYSSPYPGNTWTLSTSTSSLFQTIRFLDYSPTLDVFVGFDHTNASTNQYVYCAASDLNAWQFLTLPTSFIIRGSTWLPIEKMFVAWGSGGNIYYSTDGLSWTSVLFPNKGDIRDICIKHEVVSDTGAFRFFYSVTQVGYFGSTSFPPPSASSIVPIPVSNPLSTSTDVLCWNPQTRRFLAVKNASSQFNVVDENLAPVTGSVSSHGNKGSRSYLPPALWVPEVRCHFLSRLTIANNEVVNGTMMWNGGKDTNKDLKPFPNRVCDSGTLNSMTNTQYVMGRVAYLPSKMTFFAPFYSGQLTTSTTGVTNNIAMMVYRWTLIVPPSYIPYTTPPTLYRNIPNLSNLTLFDRYDRLINTSQGSDSVKDYIIGGIGSETTPLKNAYFSNTIKISGSGSYSLTSNHNLARPSLQVHNLHPRGNILDNMITAPQSDSVRKGMISATAIHDKNWTSSLFSTAVVGLQIEMNIKTIGFPLNLSFLLNRDGKIWYNSSSSTTFATQTLQSSVTGVTGTNPFGQDIAYSPTLNMFVYANETLWYAYSDTTSPNLATITGAYAPCKQPPSIGTVTFPNPYAHVEWIPWFGDTGAFVAMRGGFLYNSAPTNSNDHFIFSYDGINFQKFTVNSEFNNPAVVSTTSKFFTGYAHDPALREFAVAERAEPAGGFGASLHYIAKTGNDTNYRMKKVTSFAPPTTSGTHLKIAFSPKLRIWVAVLGVTGTTGAAITTNNLYYSTPPNYNSSNTFGLNSTWTSVMTKHIGAATAGYCNWVDVKWHETLQMFIAVNTNAYSGAPNVLDSSIWYSLDGISWSSVGRNPPLGHPTGDFANLLEGYTQGIAIDPITDSIFHFNDISPPYVTGYTFDMKNNTTVMHHNYQYGSTIAPSNNPALGAAVQWTINFPKAFTVAPSHVLFNIIVPASGVVYSMSTGISARTTTSFTINAIGTAGAVATGAPTIMWQAWE